MKNLGTPKFQIQRPEMTVVLWASASRPTRGEFFRVLAFKPGLKKFGSSLFNGTATGFAHEVPNARAHIKMTTYSLESHGSTSTTSCTSYESSGIIAHIGDIDEGIILSNCQPENSAEVDIPSIILEDLEEAPSDEERDNDDDDDDASASSSASADAISFDSAMERIRNEVWQKVRDAKKNRREKTSSTGRTSVRDDSVFDDSSISSGTPDRSAGPGRIQRNEIVVVTDDQIDFRSPPSRPILNSFERQPLLDEDMRTAGNFQYHFTHDDDIEQYRDLVVDDYIQSFSSEDMTTSSEADRVGTGLHQLQNEEIDSVFESILALDLEVEKPEEPTSSLSSQSPVTKASGLYATLDSKSSEPMLRVKVFGSLENTLLCLPISMVEKRENEMFGRAYKVGLRVDQWNGSLLTRLLKGYYPWYRDNIKQSLYTLQLYPESDCAEANYSQDFRWQSWINQCIESFYKTGKLRVPDFCTGSDVLTALQYFGILYDPDQLVFDSFSTFMRVKLWSEYFTHRDTIAAWITKQLNEPSTEHQHHSTRIFSTCPHLLEPGCVITIGKQQSEVFDGGITMVDSMKDETVSQSCMFVYRFFNDSDDENGEPANIDFLVREDFREYFRKVVYGVNSSFPKKLTTIHHPDGTCEELELATLFIQLEDPAYLNRDRIITSAVQEEYLENAFDEATDPENELPSCHAIETQLLSRCQSLSEEVKLKYRALETGSIPCQLSAGNNAGGAGQPDPKRQSKCPTKSDCRAVVDAPVEAQCKVPSNVDAEYEELEARVVARFKDGVLADVIKPDCREICAEAISSLNSLARNSTSRAKVGQVSQKSVDSRPLETTPTEPELRNELKAQGTQDKTSTERDVATAATPGGQEKSKTTLCTENAITGEPGQANAKLSADTVIRAEESQRAKEIASTSSSLELDVGTAIRARTPDKQSTPSSVEHDVQLGEAMHASASDKETTPSKEDPDLVSDVEPTSSDRPNTSAADREKDRGEGKSWQPNEQSTSIGNSHASESIQDTRFPGDLWMAWRPDINPDCILSSSSFLKITTATDHWTSWNQMDPEPSVESDLTNSIQHIEPFDSILGCSVETTGMRQQHVPMLFDHVYEDLMLQDTHFNGSWEKKPVPENIHITTALSREPHNVAATKTSGHRRVRFHPDNRIFSYKPNDFVCDIFELFDPSDGGVLGKDDDGVHSLEFDQQHRSHQIPNRHLNQTIPFSREQDPIFVETVYSTDASTALSSNLMGSATKIPGNILPTCNLGIPGIDFPDDERC
ncbi:expressed unknown protein [Seminavis robusta]|uniref:Uncharacterized protein n=1 Tax=Seminavis robusta TaxID=568900 RepID=A0A9N8DSR0_9STRA|nr:expressed unknown protein [Seminavis robusta]|eukprot:Sro254_g100090.1 n/a (1270) ;mRNA; f:12100-16187